MIVLAVPDSIFHLFTDFIILSGLPDDTVSPFPAERDNKCMKK
jgi:hypothetical protein